MKLGLQIILGILSLIPLMVSMFGLTLGTNRFLSEALITPDFDSHYRYLTGYYFSLCLFVWWIIPRIEKHTAILRILCGGIFLGGIGRVFSMYQVGMPNPSAVGFTCLELILPLLCIWQAKLPRSISDRQYIKYERS